MTLKLRFEFDWVILFFSWEPLWFFTALIMFCHASSDTEDEEPPVGSQVNLLLAFRSGPGPYDHYGDACRRAGLYQGQKRTNSVALSPQANYTDRVASAYRRNLALNLESRRLLFMVRPLWREDGSVIYMYNCFWASPAWSTPGPESRKLVTIIYRFI
jgi:hypothetical protein